MAVIIAAIAKNEGITEKVKYLEQQKVHLTVSVTKLNAYKNRKH